MHLITITRPFAGRWQSGLWVMQGPFGEDLVLDQLPVYLGEVGDFACGSETCAALNLSDTLVKWTADLDGVKRH